MGGEKILRVEGERCARMEGKTYRVEGKDLEGWEGNGGGKMCNGGKGETYLGWNAEIWCELNRMCGWMDGCIVAVHM